MAGGVQQSSVGGTGKRKRRSLTTMSEINVTPLVDVMLVLLIIFMVTAPLLAVGVPVDLPETKAKQIDSNAEPLTISVNGDGQIFLQEDETPYEELIPRLMALASNGYEERIYIRADKSVDYGTVLKVMGAINGAGFKKLAMVSAEEPK